MTRKAKEAQVISVDASTFDEVYEQIDMAIEIDRPVMIWGPPGIGKSALGRLIAEKRKLNYVDIRMSLLNPVDLRGIPMANTEDKVAEWLKPAFIPTEEGNLINFDEMNVAPQTVQAAAYQFILDRRCGDHELPKNTFIIACGNRACDQAVVFPMPAPLRNRFIHINMRDSLSDWIGWAREAKVHSAVIGYLEQNPNALFEFDKNAHNQNFPSPRSWEYTSDIIKKASGDDHVVTNNQRVQQFSPLVEGCLGKGRAIEFIAFLEVASKLPDVRKIVLEGAKPKCPKDPATIYALCSSAIAILHDEAPNSDDAKVVQMLVNIVEYAVDMDQKEWAVTLSKQLGQTPYWNKHIPDMTDLDIIEKWSDMVGAAVTFHNS